MAYIQQGLSQTVQSLNGASPEQDVAVTFETKIPTYGGSIAFEPTRLVVGLDEPHIRHLPVQNFPASGVLRWNSTNKLADISIDLLDEPGSVLPWGFQIGNRQIPTDQKRPINRIGIVGALDEYGWPFTIVDLSYVAKGEFVEPQLKEREYEFLDDISPREDTGKLLVSEGLDPYLARIVHALKKSGAIRKAELTESIPLVTTS